MLEAISWAILGKMQLRSMSYLIWDPGGARGLRRASHMSVYVCPHGMVGILGTGSPGKALGGKLFMAVGS